MKKYRMKWICSKWVRRKTITVKAESEGLAVMLGAWRLSGYKPVRCLEVIECS